MAIVRLLAHDAETLYLRLEENHRRAALRGEHVHVAAERDLAAGVGSWRDSLTMHPSTGGVW